MLLCKFFSNQRLSKSLLLILIFHNKNTNTPNCNLYLTAPLYRQYVIFKICKIKNYLIMTWKRNKDFLKYYRNWNEWMVTFFKMMDSDKNPAGNKILHLLDISVEITHGRAHNPTFVSAQLVIGIHFHLVRWPPVYRFRGGCSIISTW